MDHARRTRDARRWRAGCALILLGALALGSVTPKPLAQETGANPAAAQPAPIRFEEVARFEVRPEGGSGAFNALAFSPDSRFLLLLTPRTGYGYWPLREALLLDAATGREVIRHRGVMALSPDRRWLVARGEDGSARLIETATGTEALAIGPATSLAFSFDGRVLAVTSDNQSLGTTTRLIDTAARQEVGSFTIDPGVSIYIDSVTSYGGLATSGRELDRVIETPNGQVLVRLRTPTPRPPESFASSPDGRWEALVTPNPSAGNLFNIWLRVTGSERFTPRGGCDSGSLPTIAFSPDSRFLAAACYSLHLFDLFDTRPQRSLMGLEAVSSIAFSPDGRWLMAGMGRELRLFDPASGTLLAQLPQEGRVDAVAFSPDGTLLATLSTARPTADTAGPEVRPPTTVRLLRVDR